MLLTGDIAGPGESSTTIRPSHGVRHGTSAGRRRHQIRQFLVQVRKRGIDSDPDSLKATCTPPQSRGAASVDGACSRRRNRICPSKRATAPFHVSIGSLDAQPYGFAFDRDDRDRSFAVRPHNSFTDLATEDKHESSSPKVGKGFHGLCVRPQPQLAGRFLFLVTLLSHGAPPLRRKDLFSGFHRKRSQCQRRRPFHHVRKWRNIKDLRIRAGQDW